jgi:hypothetical protein
VVATGDRWYGSHDPEVLCVLAVPGGSVW